MLNVIKYTLFFFLISILVYFVFINKPYIELNNNEKIHIEYSKTQKERELGLSYRSTLPENMGMLFVYDTQSSDPFWMKDMQFPLDIIFLNERFEIVDIYQDQIPCENNKDCKLIYSSTPYRYVLEVNEGIAKENNLKVGDIVRLHK